MPFLDLILITPTIILHHLFFVNGIIFTTLPKKSFAVDEVLEWYRIRWQIELVFKRFKSLAKLGHLPKYDEESSRAWLYGKLFVCLLTEKLVDYAHAISPWGYSLSYNKDI